MVVICEQLKGNCDHTWQQTGKIDNIWLINGQQWHYMTNKQVMAEMQWQEMVNCSSTVATGNSDNAPYRAIMTKVQRTCKLDN